MNYFLALYLLVFLTACFFGFRAIVRLNSNPVHGPVHDDSDTERLSGLLHGRPASLIRERDHG